MLFFLSNVAWLLSSLYFYLRGELILLSTEQCHELRDKGILKMLVKILHQHTFEDGQDLEAITSNYLKGVSLRYNSSAVAKHIIQETAESKKELKVWNHLGELRDFVKTMFLYKQSPARCYHPKKNLKAIYALWKDPEIHDIFVELGGVYVLIDVIQTESRIHKISSEGDCDSVRYWAVYLLYRVMHSKRETRTVIASHPLLLKILVEWLHAHQQDLGFAKAIAYFFEFLTRSTDYRTIQDAGVVECFTQAVMKITDRRTLYWLLTALTNMSLYSEQNCYTMCHVDGAVRFLLTALLDGLDNLTDPEKPDNEVTIKREDLPIYVHSAALLLLRNIVYRGEFGIPAIEEQERLEKICLMLVELLNDPPEKFLLPIVDTIYFMMLFAPQTRTSFKQFGVYSILLNGYYANWFAFNKTTESRSLSILHILWQKRRCRVRF